ncbi:putative mitochondrial ribosomal protein L37 [Lyophyllum shimeji]|uniref:Large ribosomal subunit protein mL54 n=1 Tax=Lyophyllum shimeji TaxID=47721 RepID=A0A9P3UHV5_LYOSH|nr:putative mitochondrial ribosomal protein L37 [Lyophyllum shimeji]
MSFLRVLQRPQFCSLCRARGFFTTAVSRSNAAEKPKKAPAGGAAARPPSSCARDTVITGVNYLKGQPPVLARADEEYPEWLWTILQPKVYPDDGPGQELYVDAVIYVMDGGLGWFWTVLLLFV